VTQPLRRVFKQRRLSRAAARRHPVVFGRQAHWIDY